MTYLVDTLIVSMRRACEAIANSLCSICFFSSLNKDIITTRVFEIIACGGVLLAQRKGFVETIFIEGKEALYFSTKQDLLAKINYLKKNLNIRKEIADSGYKKLLKTENAIADRAKMIIKDVHSLYG